MGKFLNLVAVTLIAFARAAHAADAPMDISPLLKAACDKYKLPGMVACVVDGTDITSSGAAGVRHRGADAAVTLDDQFHLGSDTKAITATLCAILVEDGKLSWDTTLATAFPELAAKMLPEWRAVTLEQLLTHRSGAPGDLADKPIWAKLWLMQTKPVESRAALLEYVVTHAPEAPTGTKAIYSNAGVTIAGHLCEKIEDKPWETLVEERIFKPLDMKSGGFGAPTGDQPWGHQPNGTPVKPGPKADNPPGIGPAATVHCTLADWAKFVAFHLSSGKSNPGLLKPESFDKLHTSTDGQYAMGWLTADRPWAGGTALTHAGSNTMWYCVAWLAPKKNFAVLVMTNQGGDGASKAADDIASALILQHK